MFFKKFLNPPLSAAATALYKNKALKIAEKHGLKDVEAAVVKYLETINNILKELGAREGDPNKYDEVTTVADAKAIVAKLKEKYSDK